MKKLVGLLVILSLWFVCGCDIRMIPKEEEKKELPFIILSEEVIPEEVKKLIEEKKEAEMKLTYVDEKYRYIVVGYGKQKTGGYSIYIDDLYATDNAVYLDTTLLGPKNKELKENAPSYPVIVLRVMEMSLPVVFR